MSPSSLLTFLLTHSFLKLHLLTLHQSTRLLRNPDLSALALLSCLVDMDFFHFSLQVCSAERLCSSVRKRLGDLDTRLSALLEAKTLAVSGTRQGAHILSLIAT